MQAFAGLDATQHSVYVVSNVSRSDFARAAIVPAEVPLIVKRTGSTKCVWSFPVKPFPDSHQSTDSELHFPRRGHPTEHADSTTVEFRSSR
jgi:hypothetical protein